jgi:hypothetical protein
MVPVDSGNFVGGPQGGGSDGQGPHSPASVLGFGRGPRRYERDLKAKLDALGPRVRAELLDVLMMPDHDRARRIRRPVAGPAIADARGVLIDAEEQPATRGILVGMLREDDLRR